jgi:hypothetical protein
MLATGFGGRVGASSLSCCLLSTESVSFLIVTSSSLVDADRLDSTQSLPHHGTDLYEVDQISAHTDKLTLSCLSRHPRPATLLRGLPLLYPLLHPYRSRLPRYRLFHHWRQPIHHLVAHHPHLFAEQTLPPSFLHRFLDGTPLRLLPCSRYCCRSGVPAEAAACPL